MGLNYNKYSQLLQVFFTCNRGYPQPLQVFFTCNREYCASAVAGVLHLQPWILSLSEKNSDKGKRSLFFVLNTI